MKSKAYNARNEAREERNREALAAGLMAERFPDVASITVTMNYNRGSHSSMLRTLHFNPGSTAFFKVGSVGDEADPGGIDLTNFIHRMIRSRQKTAKGEVSFSQQDTVAYHPKVDYEVAITYA